MHRCSLLLFALTFSVLHAEDKPATPASAPTPAAPVAEVPKGEVTKYTFNESKIFPGTTRDYWVYVPKQYDPAKPACVHVNQDGVQFGMPGVFDKLIAAKEMPVTIGVFIMHGRVKAPNGEALDRFNRSYEYDGLGDGYARFVLDEILPEVEKKKTSDGREIHLSKDGNDRCIGGSSSGAICAFNAAWERPDAFKRVFSTIGTYVGLRGANNFPILIRKFEPKPLRVFLQDGSNDQNIYCGDWWMANQEMERSLTYAGYEVNHAWGTGGHDGKQATEILPDAMRWLWKDWPAPIKVGLGSKQMQEILIPGEGWKVVEGEYEVGRRQPMTSSNIGNLPADKLTTNATGEVFFSDAKSGQNLKIGLDGKVTPGTLEQLSAMDNLHAQAWVAKHDGSSYAVCESESAVPFKTIQLVMITPKGEKKVMEDKDHFFRNIYGLTLSTDQTLLYVADSKSHWVYSYQIQQDGTLAAKQKYYWLHVPDDAEDSGAEDMCVDKDGRLYVATRMGVQVCDQAGRVLCIIPFPDSPYHPAYGVALGGENFDTLYACDGAKIYKRKVKTKGVNGFMAPNKPAGPRL